jgi:hypothetical protein
VSSKNVEKALFLVSNDGNYLCGGLQGNIYIDKLKPPQINLKLKI